MQVNIAIGGAGVGGEKKTKKKKVRQKKQYAETIPSSSQVGLRIVDGITERKIKDTMIKLIFYLFIIRHSMTTITKSN